MPPGGHSQFTMSPCHHATTPPRLTLLTGWCTPRAQRFTLRTLEVEMFKSSIAELGFALIHLPFGNIRAFGRASVTVSNRKDIERASTHGQARRWSVGPLFLDQRLA